MSKENTITVSVVRSARRGLERRFEQELHAFVKQTLTLPGQLGVHVIRPVPGSGSRDYGIVRKFANKEALQQFHSSEEYRQWSQSVGELTEGEARTEELNGLESWFTPPGVQLHSLPRWKMAIATYLGVFPLVTILNLTMAPLIRNWNFIAKNAALNAVVVVILTWILMPLITKLLHSWLYSSDRSSAK